MTSTSVRIEPYLAGAGVHAPQLEFVKRQMALLSPGFETPHEDWRTGTYRHLGDGEYESVWEFGTDEGYRVTLNETLESRASGVVARSVTVEAFGLPEGLSIWTRYESSFSQRPYLELHISGPEEAVAIRAERFRHQFGHETLDPSA